MEKKYIAPKIEIIKIQIKNIMAGSITGTNVGLRRGGYTDEEGITEAGARMGRFSTWEDE